MTSDGVPVRGCGLRTAIFLQGRPNVLIEEFYKKLTKLLDIAKLELDIL
jgi:hypothetical protein